MNTQIELDINSDSDASLEQTAVRNLMLTELLCIGGGEVATQLT
jgi:hypothetical protein